MKKHILLFSFLSLFISGRTSFSSFSNNNNNSTNEVTTHNYEISESSISLEVDKTKKLYISDNGTIINNVVWSSDNTKIASVTSNGNVIAIKAEKANITGTIDSNNKLTCEVTVTSSTQPITNNDTAIVKFFKTNSYALDDGVSYGFVSAKSEYSYVLSQTLVWDLYFIYDTSDDSCIIKSQMNGTLSSGKKFYYYGYNVFYWGDYKNGLFTGGYCQETGVGTSKYVTLEVKYDNSSLVFRTDHTLTMGYDLTYTLTKNEFSSSATSDDVLTIFSRVTECCGYAHEVFTNYNSNLTLY